MAAPCTDALLRFVVAHLAGWVPKNTFSPNRPWGTWSNAPEKGAFNGVVGWKTRPGQGSHSGGL